jgi:hypothetical protein
MADGTLKQRMEDSGLTHGPVSSYLLDAGLISPNESQIEAIEFHVDVATDGAIVDQSPSVRIQPGFSFLFSQLLGARSFGDTDIEDADLLHLVSFNVQNEGRNKAVYRRAIPMNILTCPGGPAHAISWHGIFRFFESADISVDWTIDPAYAGAAAERRYTVLLIGEIVNDAALPKVRR